MFSATRLYLAADVWLDRAYPKADGRRLRQGPGAAFFPDACQYTSSVCREKNIIHKLRPVARTVSPCWPSRAIGFSYCPSITAVLLSTCPPLKAYLVVPPLSTCPPLLSLGVPGSVSSRPRFYFGFFSQPVGDEAQQRVPEEGTAEGHQASSFDSTGPGAFFYLFFSLRAGSVIS